MSEVIHLAEVRRLKAVEREVENVRAGIRKALAEGKKTAVVRRVEGKGTFNHTMRLISEAEPAAKDIFAVYVPGEKCRELAFYIVLNRN